MEARQTAKNKSNEEDESIDTIYSIMVESFRTSESKKIFENQGWKHTNIVLTNIFKGAKSNINILTGKMDLSALGDSPDLEQSLNEFISKKGTSMNIVLAENSSSQNNKVLDSIKERDNVHLYHAPKNLFDKGYSGKKFHFTVADDKAFRFEYDIDNYMATCSFNSVEHCKTLNKHFKYILDQSKKTQ